MKEVRQYSDKTIATAARRVRRALPFIPHKDLSDRDRVDVLVTQLIRQGLEPIDIARSNGEAAVMAIASALPLPQPIEDVATDRALSPQRMPGAIVIDSMVTDFEFMPGRFMKLAEPRRVVTVREPSTTWQRVIARVLKMPVKP